MSRTSPHQLRNRLRRARSRHRTNKHPIICEHTTLQDQPLFAVVECAEQATTRVTYESPDDGVQCDLLCNRHAVAAAQGLALVGVTVFVEAMSS